jgi:hypothetical protein
MTALGPAGGPPPPSLNSRQGWPPPPDIQLPPINPDQEDDPWASWYGKPRGSRQDTPSATLPRVQQGYDTQGYGPAQPYPDAPPYGGQPYPGQPYGGQPYPGEQYPGQQYGDAQQYGQYNGPVAGQQYGGGQYGDQQFTGASPYADESQPYPPQQPGGPGMRRSLRSRGPLVPALAIGAVALIAIVALIVANSGGGSPSQTAATGSATASASAPPVSDAARKAAAQRLAALLPQSGSDHAAVNGAVFDLDACKHLKPARTALGTARQNRENLLTQIRTLPGRDALSPDLLQALTGAEQASAQVDGDLHDWAQDLINGGCNPKTAQSDAHYQASLGGDDTASTEKAKFLSLWNPLAKKYGLQTYQAGQI